MAIIHMKKVALYVDEAYREQLTNELAENKDFYPTKNPLIGFMPADKAESFCQSIKHDGLSYTITDPSIETDDNPPVILKSNFFTAPFIPYVEKYALPLYYDIDPSTLFALGFCVLFGIMFGDIGQGIVLVLLGLIFHKKQSTRIFSRVGLFSIVFGIYYGSIFGNEELIPELLHHYKIKLPHFELLAKENTESLLLMMLLVGAILILASMLLHIVDCAREQRIKPILADRNGVAGLLYYGSLFGLALTYALHKSIPGFVWAIGLACLAVAILMFLFMRKGSLKKRLEYLWETVLSDTSATMSFLMVGCFALAHATLMMVVYKVAELTILPIVIIILGNMLVMGIEATEVYHQCMHLCFKTLLQFITTEKDD